MASHLEHLKLSSEAHWTGEVVTSHMELLKLSSEGVDCTRPILSPPPQLSMKTVASCPRSVECQVSRKRCSSSSSGLDEHGGSSWSNKRLRLDAEAAIPSGNSPPSLKDENRTGHGMEFDQHLRNGTPVLTMHGVSDLSSIPEETEPSQQPSSPSVSLDPCIEASVGDEKEKAPPPLLLSLNLRPTLSSAFLSPSPMPPPPPPLSLPPLNSDAGVSTFPRSVWVAPELQGISGQTRSPLPISIVKEM